MREESAVIHLNAVNFLAAAEALRDGSLRGQVFAVAFPGQGRARLLDVSRPALREGIEPGMTVEEAVRRLGDFRIVAPSPGLYLGLNRGIERICARHAPLLENSGGGHFFLDLSGTRRLAGDYVDQAARIRNEVASEIGIDAATALASNKLVAKVGTRSLKPDGFVSVRPGEEAAFLRHQDLGLLPGVGERIGRVLRVAGVREIGDLATLGDGELAGLLGRQGEALRDAARGIDPSPVQDGDLGARRIEGRRDFAGDVIEEAEVLGALIGLVEACGLELRRARLAARRVEVAVDYADGVLSRGATARRGPGTAPLALDSELIAAARLALSRAETRRVRVSALALALAALEPSGIQLDLFEPEPLRAFAPARAPGPWARAREERLQAAADEARERFGQRALTRAAAV